MTELNIFEIAGAKFAAIPLEKYEAMLEDIETLHDIRLYHAVKENPQERIPFELVERIMEGENRIKVYREYRNLTQDMLAGKAGISRALLAQMETGRKNGSVKTLKGLAKALGVDLEDIAS